jgi:toxin ParE1/3/4
VTLQFTATARVQFLAAVTYIRRDNPVAAMRFRRHAEKVLRRLMRFPDSGRVIPEFPELPHREVIVAPYRFFYRRVGNTIWVMGVWHSAQLPQEPKG